jgi:hypothetical protein
MDAETLTALESSIEHWKRMRDDPFSGRDEPVGWQCALCSMYYMHTTPTTPCVGCPVMERSGEAHCLATPYAKATDAFYTLRNAHRCASESPKDLEDWQRHADEEIAFLESLRPNEKTNEQKEDQ